MDTHPEVADGIRTTKKVSDEAKAVMDQAVAAVKPQFKD